MESMKNVLDPKHCPKTKQTENKAVSKEKYPYTLQDFNSPLWESYRGAYGNVVEYLVILMGEKKDAPETFKLRRLDNTQRTNYEMAFDNLCENLWHQMSFYSATWLVLPYLAKLMENWEKEEDKEWLFQGILAAGSCLATDVFGERPKEDDVQESYTNAILQIRDITINFLTEYIDCVQKKEISWRREFAFAVTAILGEKRLAFMFFMSGLESCYIACPGCENCDEEIEFGYFDPAERIEKANIPVNKWDVKDFSDIQLWLFNLFTTLDDVEGIERLCYCFGNYTCPECGEVTPVLTGMEGYFLP